MPQTKKEIACTRSFGVPITTLPPLCEAVSEYASRAAEKLRKQSSLASQLLVFIHTSPFRDDPQYARSIVVPLRRPTSDSAKLVQAALLGLRHIFRPGFKLSKAGVILMDLQDGNVHQGELDLERDDAAIEGRSRLMSALDAVNLRYGRGTMKLASAGLRGDKSS